MKHVLPKSNKKGIHEVKKGKERVAVGSVWSIEVPTGYSYCADTEMTATDVGGTHYLLQIQRTSDSDFEDSYASEVSVTVRDQFYVLDNYYEDATIQIENFDQIAQQLSLTMGGYELIRSEKDILIGCAEDTLFSHSFMYFILTGGSNALFTLQITFSGDMMFSDEAPDIAKQFADSIEPICVADYAASLDQVKLSKSYVPDFDNAEYATVDGSFRVPVPNGFEIKQSDGDLIKLLIAPKDFDFSGDINEASEAKVALLIQQQVFDFTGKDLDSMGMITLTINSIHNQSPVQWFNGGVFTDRCTNKLLVVNSYTTNNACDKNLNPILICVGKKVYFGYVTLHYGSNISDEPDTMRDAQIITSSWLSRILLKGEKEGKRVRSKEQQFKVAIPDKSLYPHYDHMMNSGANLNMPGVTVVVNSSGTEYQFYDLKDDLPEDASEELREAIGQLSDKGADLYTLADRAAEMRSLFHVSPETFDPHHDKECELAEGYMQKAYMMSALRSFAWTLADYCKKQNKNTGDIDIKSLKEIIDFVAKRKWLNYDGKSYCKGLCGTQDFAVYYLPDQTPESIKTVFRPSQEQLDQVKKIQETLPNYNPIAEQVGPLDELREDLLYILPAIEKIYDDLKSNRNYNEPLTGNYADILYAWCALAYAARAPFYFEDGPMTCFFTQIESGEEKPMKKKSPSKKKTTRSKVTDCSTLPQKNMAVWGFTAAEVPVKRTKLIDKNNGYPIRFLPHSATQKSWENDMMTFQYYCSSNCPGFAENVSSIIEQAEKYSHIFSSDGTSSDLKAGKLKNSAPIHALRSFIWTAAEMQGGKVKSSFPSDAPEEMWMDLAAFIKMHGYANYSSVDKKTKRFGAALLRKEEVRSIYSDACGFNNDHWLYYDASLGKTMSNASISSLFQVVDVLLQTAPVMDLYYNSLKNEDNHDDIAEAMKTILKGWLVFAFACGQPFFIVPGEYCTEDMNTASAAPWTKAPEINRTSDSKFTLCGTVIVKANDCGKEVIIPEGVTGIIVNEDTISGLQNAFKNTDKIVYPHSYTGAIVVPPSVKEIDVLGSPEVITKVRLSDEKLSLRSLNFLGKPKSVGSSAFYGLNGLKSIVLPEGVEKLYYDAFQGWHSHGELFLPESLTSLDGDVFNAYRIDEDVTIKIYKDCPAKTMIKAQLDDHKSFLEEQERKYPGVSSNRKYGIKLIELESPWNTRAKSFMSGLGNLYDEVKPNVSVETVKEILEETIGLFEDYLKCKSFIISNAKENNRLRLVELVENSTDDQQVYELLPEELAEDINQQINDRLREERKRKLKEIKELSQSNSIDNLKKAIEMLEELKTDGMNMDPVIEQFLKKIEGIKAAKYSEAEALAAKRTVPSISEALVLMKSISPYKDSSDRIIEFDKLLDNEKEYGTAVSLMQRTEPQIIKDTRKKFEDLGGYKDSESKVQECSNILAALVKDSNEKARALLDSENDVSLGKALGVYRYLASFDEDNERLESYTAKIASINEMTSLKDTLNKLKEEHATLGGLFKKKKRLEVEEKIKQVEAKIEGIKRSLQGSINNG